MRRTGLATAGAALFFCAGPSQGAIVFSEVTIGGSLSSGATFSTGASDIDFVFLNALVGDPVAPLRSGDLTITSRSPGTPERP